ncbi:MAG: PEP-CTERM sorting domain-containing protein [Okeania sp. SIO2G4]|uniref:PEP-CTERM sorting domain-containing protein n=1 Tax=unclassified Okeania TaxID=2634635 RepID=UPI0013BAB99E|nr:MULTISPECIES: PEP-CTERM sorting domain-containing protein [unclassified Okeania]NEP07281.1 PEP-CTERM sorting domain-containing protein [Okeania sp. SIO4D6]NEP42906.1 PEP-CTERM sorting domain-containing protein [Okeania sp. SIO2H7]NEP75764.1 PEP-CTERM sorting domain-containing protein [Okeania sp. SIO2G5]NEP96932.1 PEP-CTERM sorting domain-containing protein [Okeania sp. SIO2F5]NEQ94748.1 PEP-CTERM sorting domain-containing protein [Okeania sp. SIO2G4]
MKNLTLLSVTVLSVTSALVFGKIQAASALIWNWSYSAPGIEASGNLTTNDTPDDLGFYLITGITGTRNDETIIGLQPTGTSIPGNEPFVLDNIISLNPDEQLTSSGFGYFTSEGNFVNMFFADFLQPPGYFEIFSAPPFIPGFENFGPEDSELPVSFSASFSAAPITVPEPTSILSFLALGTLGAVSTVKRKLKPSKSTANPS